MKPSLQIVLFISLSLLVSESLAFPADVSIKQDDSTDPPLSSFTDGGPNTVDAQIDVGVLNYALTLENLEYTFFTEALNNYTAANFTSDSTYRELVAIREHEKEHIEALIEAIESLNGTAVQTCTYNFNFYEWTIEHFLEKAKLLETTGVAAYAGIINRISDPNIVTLITTIATVEARHATYLNLLTGYNPFSGAFDVALGPRAILTLAANYIVSCPYEISITPYAALTAQPTSNFSEPSVTNLTVYVTCSPEPVQIGITTKTTKQKGTGVIPKQNRYCGWLYSSAQEFTPLNESDNSCVVPYQAVGDVFVFVTNSSESLADDNVLCGPDLVNIPY